MGEAGSLAPSPGPSPPPSCEPESVPGLLSIPPEILSIITESLPRRCIPNVRLVCRKLEAAAETTIRHLQIQIDPSSRGVRSQHILLNSRTDCSARGSRNAAYSFNLHPAQHHPSIGNGPNLNAPGWTKYVEDLHLTLHIDSPPNPQPNPAPLNAQMQEEGEPAAPPLEAAHPQAFQALPQPHPGAAPPHPAQPQPPALPQPPAVAALAQALANQLQQLLQQAGHQHAAGLAAGPHALLAQVEAILAMAAGGPPMQAPAGPWAQPPLGAWPPLLNPAALGPHPPPPAGAAAALEPLQPQLNHHHHEHPQQHPQQQQQQPPPPAGPQEGDGGLVQPMEAVMGGDEQPLPPLPPQQQAAAAVAAFVGEEMEVEAGQGHDHDGEDGDGDGDQDVGAEIPAGGGGYGGGVGAGAGPPGGHWLPQVAAAANPHVAVWIDLMNPLLGAPHLVLPLHHHHQLQPAGELMPQQGPQPPQHPPQVLQPQHAEGVDVNAPAVDGGGGDAAVAADAANNAHADPDNNNGAGINVNPPPPQPMPAPGLPLPLPFLQPASAVAAAAAAAAARQAHRCQLRAEASLAVQLYLMATNLLPALRRLRTLRLDHVPRRCMTAAGLLAAAAPSLTSLCILRTEVSVLLTPTVHPMLGQDAGEVAAGQEEAAAAEAGGPDGAAGHQDEAAAAAAGLAPQLLAQQAADGAAPAAFQEAAQVANGVADVVAGAPAALVQPPQPPPPPPLPAAGGAREGLNGTNGNGVGGDHPSASASRGGGGASGGTGAGDSSAAALGRPHASRVSPSAASASAVAAASSHDEYDTDNETDNNMSDVIMPTPSGSDSIEGGKRAGDVAGGRGMMMAMEAGMEDAAGGCGAGAGGGGGGGGGSGGAGGVTGSEAIGGGLSSGACPSGSIPHQRPRQHGTGVTNRDDYDYGISSDYDSSSDSSGYNDSDCERGGYGSGWESDDDMRGVGSGGGRGGGSGGGGREPEVSFWSRVASLPRLQSLTLQGGSFRGVDMAGLVALTGLQELCVVHVVNTHPGLACLSALTLLTRLVIEDLQYVGGAIHDEFCGLSRLTALRSLSFLVVGPLPAEVLAWGALTGLTQLEITNHYDEHLLPCFSTVLPRLRQLASLHLSNFDINNSLLESLRHCTQLSSVQMGRFNVTSPCKVVMRAVRVLHLAFVDDIQNTEVPLAAVFPCLMELALATRYELTHESARRIPLELLPPPAQAGRPPLPVTRLHLYDALMCPSLPSALPSLTFLRLDWNQTDTPVLLSYLTAWGQGLAGLQWAHCDSLEDGGLETLTSALPKLTQLELVRPLKLTNTGLAALTALTALTELVLAGAPQLTTAGLTSLVPQLSRLARLTLRDMAGVEPQAAWSLEGLSPCLNGLAVTVLP